MRWFLILNMIFSFACSAQKNRAALIGQDDSDAQVSVTRLTAESWKVIYTFPKPVRKVYFSNTPHVFRSKHFSIVNPNYKFDREDGKEIIQILGGELASTIEVTHGNLDTGLPFSNEFHYQFTDGSIALFTGYYDIFHAEYDSSSDQLETLQYNFTSSLDTHIWVAAKASQNSATWLSRIGKRDAFVYFGNRTEGGSEASYKIIADPQLPSWIQDMLSETGSLRKIITYYREKLFALDYSPAVYFSHSFPNSDTIEVIDSSGNRSQQSSLMSGRVLLGGKSAVINLGGKRFAAYDAGYEFLINSALFGHEIVHLWNAENIAYDRNHSWLWEGSAEAFSYFALDRLDIAPEPYLNYKRKERLVKCLKGLQLSYKNQERDFRKRSTFEYACGFLINYIIDRSATKSSLPDIYGFWSPMLKDSYTLGKLINLETFKSRLQALADAELIAMTIDNYMGSELSLDNAKGKPFFTALKALESRPTTGDSWFNLIEEAIAADWDNLDWEALERP